jgi:hypothetical protein
MRAQRRFQVGLPTICTREQTMATNQTSVIGQKPTDAAGAVFCTANSASRINSVMGGSHIV